ncbi:uncharacterized protein [Gossypium hirsutum]|uniref:Reverse transcriptase n=1 Tax=Gossypium hirsutum TaxID=3635 RepID=A0ABM3B060_GOSHI|nr:uncharacterized protein LOC121223308 [Gossypium hirsutum]
MERVRKSCGFLHGIDVSSNGSRGGLCLAWLEHKRIQLKSFSRRHIDVIIDEEDEGHKWRGNLPENNIQERLDRGVATAEWLHLFPDFQLQHLPHTFSDHYPLLVNTKECRERTQKSFKFEAWWVLEDSFLNTVKDIWEHSEGDFLSKLDSMKEGLERWASQIRFSRKVKKLLSSKLVSLLEEERDEENIADLIDTKIQLNFEIEKD